MRLKVNGVDVRVVDRIEIEIDVHREGEDLINGMQIRCHGGSLTIRQGSHPSAAFHWDGDHTLVVHGKRYGAYFYCRDPFDHAVVVTGGDVVGQVGSPVDPPADGLNSSCDEAP